MLRRGLAVSVIAFAVIAMTPVAAFAHGVGGIGPSNYDTRLLKVEPDLPDVEITVIDLGSRIEVRNDGDAELVVLGYEGEPYLRIGPDGVFENERSPATWANRDRYAEVAAPADVDAQADPVWRHVSDHNWARFHWHLAHWMSRSLPGVVDDDPKAEHHLLDWDLTMVRDGTEIVASGELRWVPGPSPAPFILLALALATVTVLAGRTRRWRWVLVAVFSILIVTETLHVVGIWPASVSSPGQKVLENLYSLIGIVLAGIVVIRLANVRRDPYDQVPTALIAGIVLAVAGGLADLENLRSSQLSTELPAGVARTGIAVTLGLGVGAVVTAAIHLRRPAPAPDPTPAQ